MSTDWVALGVKLLKVKACPLVALACAVAVMEIMMMMMNNDWLVQYMAC